MCREVSAIHSAWVQRRMRSLELGELGRQLLVASRELLELVVRTLEVVLRRMGRQPKVESVASIASRAAAHRELSLFAAERLLAALIRVAGPLLQQRSLALFEVGELRLTACEQVAGGV